MAGSSGAGFTHFNKVSSVNGLYAGAAGSEVQVTNASGTLYQAGTQITASAAEINQLKASTRIVSATAATLTVTQASHDGRIILLDRAAGIAVTLPAASGSGAIYRFLNKTTVTSNTTTIKVANASDSFLGNALQLQDAGSGVVGWEAAANDDTMTFDGSTKGGIAGDWIEIVDVATNLFLVRAILAGTGTEATPFSATV